MSQIAAKEKYRVTLSKREVELITEALEGSKEVEMEEEVNRLKMQLTIFMLKATNGAVTPAYSTKQRAVAASLEESLGIEKGKQTWREKQKQAFDKELEGK